LARTPKEVQIDVKRMTYLIRRLFKEKMRTNSY
jgi:hypothetical protein